MAAPGQLLIGLDVGTTHVKAALVGSDGSVVHVARRDTPTTRGPGGRAAHPPDQLLGAVEAVVAECATTAGERPGSGRVAAIGIASMAEAGTLVDARGRPTGELIAWYDSRSDREAGEIEAAVGAGALFARTGLRAMGKQSLAKLCWIARHRPSALRRARRWAGVAELVGLAWTGSLATNASLACRTLAFDAWQRRWDTDLLALAGLSPDAMPVVLPLGVAVGGLGDHAAVRLGLSSGLPVAIGGHDHLVGAIGAGVLRAGMALDSMGSAEACLVVADRPPRDERLRLAGFSVGCHPVDGLGYLLAGLQASGAVVEWFIDTFTVPSGAARRSGEGAGSASRYSPFESLLAEAGPGPAGVVALPYPRGRTAPEPDPAARLAFAGLGLEDGLPRLAAALVDGAACAVRWIFDELEAVSGIGIETVTLIGGGARLERWRSAKAALARAPLRLVATDEATALGAALVGGVAGGVFASIDEAVAAGAARGEPIRVGRVAARRYESYYRERFLPAARGGAIAPRQLPREAATSLRIVRSPDLQPAEAAALRALLRAAFEPGEGSSDDEAFSEDDWHHALGGVHFLLERDLRIVAHASVVERALHVADMPVRTGYVEAVATRVDEQGRGHGTRVMAAVGAYIDATFELGALGTGRHGFYERLGWRTWRGPTSVRTGRGDRRTPDDDGYVLVLPTRSTPTDLDLDLPLSCEWRPGDVW